MDLHKFVKTDKYVWDNSQIRVLFKLSTADNSTPLWEGLVNIEQPQSCMSFFRPPHRVIFYL